MMNWKKVSEVIYEPISGEWGDEGNNVKIIRTTNFTNEGKLNLSEVVCRNVDLKKIEKKKLEFGDTIIEKSGGSPSQPVGRVVYFDITNEIFLCNNFTSVLRLKDKNFDSKYFFWFLFHNHQSKNTLKFQNKTTGIINLQLSRYINELDIKVRALATQQHIAQVLDQADALRQQNRQLLGYYDELLQSTFIELFGDPVKNEKGWEVKKLGEVVEKFKYGTNEKSDSIRYENTIPIIRIPNVLDNKVNFRDLKYSELSEKEMSEVELKNGDLLFVRSNGNPAYIGRCAVFFDEQKCGFASYLIRARLKKDTIILPQIIQFIISYETYRPIILKKATTTAGNYNINTESLKSLPIPIPPLPLQQHFAKIVEEIEAQKSLVQQSLAESEALFEGLLAEYFG